MLSNLKAKLVCGAGALLAAGSALAEDTPSAFDSALNDIKTGMTGTIDKIIPVVAVVVVAAIGLWAIPFAWKKLRGGAGR